MPVTENTIVIHDSDPNTFIVWIFIICAILLLYFVVTTVHDINRDAKLNELREKIEEERAKRGLESI